MYKQDLTVKAEGSPALEDVIHEVSGGTAASQHSSLNEYSLSNQ